MKKITIMVLVVMVFLVCCQSSFAKKLSKWNASNGTFNGNFLIDDEIPVAGKAVLYSLVFLILQQHVIEIGGKKAILR